MKGDWLAGWLEKVAREGSCNTYNNGANLAYLPLSRKFSLQYTYPGGWVAGWSEFDYIAISAQLNWDLG